MEVSKPYTRTTKESKKNFEEGWDRIFKKTKLKKKKKNGVQQ
jgi:hypothetical protein